MNSVTTNDIRRLAMLSQIELSDDEAATLTEDIGNILNYIDKLSELDTTGVEPAYQVLPQQNIWREDEIDASTVPCESLLALAPEVENNQVKIPKVL